MELTKSGKLKKFYAPGGKTATTKKMNSIMSNGEDLALITTIGFQRKKIYTSSSTIWPPRRSVKLIVPTMGIFCLYLNWKVIKPVLAKAEIGSHLLSIVHFHQFFLLLDILLTYRKTDTIHNYSISTN